MRDRRVIAVAASALVVALALAGCAGGSGSKSSDTKLTIQDYYTSDPLKSAFENVYKTCAKKIGATVSFDHVPGNNLITKVLQQGSSKTLPDVLYLDNPDVARIAATGALSPLSDYNISTAGVAKPVASAGVYKGKLYGLAPTVNTLGLFYNKTLFAQAGISSPPTTWDELRADAKKLTSPGVAGFALGAQANEGDAWSFLPFMWSNGGNENDLSGEKTVQALQFLTDLIHDGSMPADVVNWQQGDVATQFANGKVAIMINGPWNIKGFQDTKGLDWASASVPTRVAGQKVESPLGGEAATVPNTGNKAKMQLAGKMVACSNTAKNELSIAKVSGNLPSITSAAEQYGSENPDAEPFVKLVQTARARTAILGTKWPEAAKAIYTAEGLAYTGQASPADALKQAQNQ